MTTEHTQYSYMKSSDGMVVPLTSTIVNASMHDLLADVTVTQVYENTETKNIEAIYTFPLPLDAVILDVEVRLDDRNLKGCIVEKVEAEAKYEEAIVDGNTAIMLEKVEAGLYTMNVGNLLPDHTVTISVQYAVLHRWQGDQLRFYLPTTIAPRYGVPDMDSYQVPVIDVCTKNLFAFSLKVTGLLSDAVFESPSHKVVCVQSDDATMIQLHDEMALMDRDVIINIRNPTKEHASAVYDEDVEGYVSLLSFKPELSCQDVDSPHAITVVVDCSGSMTGESISQAKSALLRIIDALNPCDFFNIILFGSTHKKLFWHMKLADSVATDKAKKFVHDMDADMGGTEIGGALHAAYRLQSKSDIPQDILLITDGEIWEGEAIICEAEKSRQRIFSVGVGSSVSEAFVQEIARATGGACELVSPNEDMAERIYRHARRMYGKRCDDVIITWSDENSIQTPADLNSIFDGDTVHVFARSQSKPKGNVEVQIRLQDDASWSFQMPLVPMPHGNEHSLRTLCRIAADVSLNELEQPQATEKALTYQLMSAWTNFLVIDQKPHDEGVQDLPELREVPHMLADGWSGHGQKSAWHTSSMGYNDIDLEAPTFLRRDSNIDLCVEPAKGSPEFDKSLDQRDTSQIKHLEQLYDANQMTLEDLGSMNVPVGALDLLEYIVDQGFDEKLVVDCFIDLLECIIDQGLDEKLVTFCFIELLLNKKETREGELYFLRRKITRAIMGSRRSPQLMQYMEVAFSDLEEYLWEK